MHILFMGQHVWPENVSGAVYATEIVDYFLEHGHQVTFATCFPNYPQGRVFDGYHNRLLSHDTYHGATILRTWSYISPNKSPVHRIVGDATFAATVFFAGLVAKRPDVILSFSPPFSLGPTAWVLSQLWGIPWILRVEDIFPEAAINVGVIQNKIAIRLLERIERFQYGHAKHISVISEGFRQKLLARGVPPEKISVIPVWADPAEVIPMQRDTPFRAAHGWMNKFILLYTGNLGVTCAIEDVLDAADILRSYEDIQFVIVGEGLKKSKLSSLAERKNLANLRFLPYQPRERFPELLATADAALVTLNEDSYSTSLPSKTFNYLASGRPIVTIAPLHSELSKLINEAKAGVCVAPGKPTELADAILKLKNSRSQQDEMGQNGRQLLESHFSRERCLGLYADMVKRHQSHEPS